MEHLGAAQLLGLLALTLAVAKLFARAAGWLGQPGVLGELVAGIVLGVSGFGLIDPKNEVFHLLSEIGVVLLLFEIGLETDLDQLIRVGAASSAVAIVGVALPFALGYVVVYWLGYDTLVAIVAGATLTATSVGITARVLSDLGRLQDLESQIILGAAVIDDVIGLVILAVVSGLTAGEPVTIAGVAWTTAIAFGFLAVTLVVGNFTIGPLANAVSRIELPGSLTTFAVILAFGLAWLANLAGSAVIIGAFATGLLLRRTAHVHEVEQGVASLGQFFIPIFFVGIGAAVDVRILNFLDPANHRILLVAGLLIVAALIGKFVAGYAPVWLRAKKSVIGAGMIPRGEVGLIFAQMGLDVGVFSAGMFSAVTFMVMFTTLIAPPLLRYLFLPTRHFP